MKCLNCGAVNPEGKKFCGDCGSSISESPSAMPMAPPSPQARRNWWNSNWRILAAVIVTVIVAFPIASQVYTQPWSKIKVKYVADLQNYETLVYGLYLDGKPIVSGAVHEELNGTQVVLDQISVDAGKYDVELDYYFTTESNITPHLNGQMDRIYEVHVNPLSVAEVPIYLSTLIEPKPIE